MAIHHFCTEDAAKYGIEEAIVLYNIGFWCATNLAKRQNIRDGRVWTYNAAPAFLELLPYLCPTSITLSENDYPPTREQHEAILRDRERRVRKFSRILKSLEDQGAVICHEYNRMKADRTKWFSLADQTTLSKYHEVCPQALKTLIGQNCPKPSYRGGRKGQSAANPHGSASDKNVRPSDKNVRPIPDNKQQIKTTTEKPTQKKQDFEAFALCLIKLVTDMIHEGGWVPASQPVPKATWLKSKAESLYGKFPDPNPADCAVLILKDWTKLISTNVNFQTGYLPSTKSEPKAGAA